MKQIEGRRKIIFGMGMFAAGLFLPSKKLIFTVRENPLGTLVGKFESHDLRFLHNRTGNKRAYLWLLPHRDGTVTAMRKFNCPPDHPYDGSPTTFPHPKEEQEEIFKLALIHEESSRLKGRPSVKYKEHIYMLERQFQEET